MTNWDAPAPDARQWRGATRGDRTKAQIVCNQTLNSVKF
jgi:hypothetical protein